ncbi:hypothetical protein [Bradyrhizobium sp. Tv2a-2]|uniref:hypothetical protein n=1 Tax=Bradyrhizobium sp. Tv2a-2 TaxID=113395 RepID=UPI0003F6E63F|nr:hypothetical protein [Bradyrhizobium sp. Tv2a-2]
MARSPNDPYDPYRPTMSEYDLDREARLEREAQFDPELAEGPASAGKMALFALGIALVLGAVFYGLNNSSVHDASTAPPAQTAQTRPANPNSQPGMTTGSAPNRTTPPQSSPTGSEVDRTDHPTAGQTNDNR